MAPSTRRSKSLDIEWRERFYGGPGTQLYLTVLSSALTAESKQEALSRFITLVKLFPDGEREKVESVLQYLDNLMGQIKYVLGELWPYVKREGLSPRVLDALYKSLGARSSEERQIISEIASIITSIWLDYESGTREWSECVELENELLARLKLELALTVARDWLGSILFIYGGKIAVPRGSEK
ncbi:MAG: hypothetical protein ACP5IE_01395 [Infirmifilum sp.]